TSAAWPLSSVRSSGRGTPRWRRRSRTANSCWRSAALRGSGRSDATRLMTTERPSERRARTTSKRPWAEIASSSEYTNDIAYERRSEREILDPLEMGWGFRTPPNERLLGEQALRCLRCRLPVPLERQPRGQRRRQLRLGDIRHAIVVAIAEAPVPWHLAGE